jgi:hypothetical protein
MRAVTTLLAYVLGAAFWMLVLAALARVVRICFRQPRHPQGHDWCSGCQQARAHLNAQHRAKGHVRVLDKRVFDQEGEA